MNRNAFIFALIALTMLLSDVRAQSAIEARSKDPIEAGFANTVSDLLARMQGEWRIKSATLMGADLPLDLKQAIACLSESDFRSAAATEPAGLV